MLPDELRYRLLRRLQADPCASQRQLAQDLGISLGSANYCLRALIGRGLVKAANFRGSNNKRAYLYRLTPMGMAEKAILAMRFLQSKEAEHARLMREIDDLRREVAEGSLRDEAS